uniref:Uncharacterized protein n=1 Tax=Anopheles merus TaxID=30066 RepID=A0A182V4H3_ANOME
MLNSASVKFQKVIEERDFFKSQIQSRRKDNDIENANSNNTPNSKSMDTINTNADTNTATNKDSNTSAPVTPERKTPSSTSTDASTGSIIKQEISPSNNNTPPKCNPATGQQLGTTTRSCRCGIVLLHSFRPFAEQLSQIIPVPIVFRQRFLTGIHTIHRIVPVKLTAIVWDVFILLYITTSTTDGSTQQDALHAQDGCARPHLRAGFVRLRYRQPFIEQVPLDQNRPLSNGKAHNVRPGRIVHPMIAHIKVPVRNTIAERDAEPPQQIVQRRHIGPARIRHPPLARVLVVELYPPHDGRVVPVGKHDNAQLPLEHIFAQFRNFRREKLFLRIDHEQCAVVGRVEAGVRSTEHFHVVASVAEVRVHVLKVGVHVIRSPVQWVGFDFQIITRQIARRIAQTMVLVPQDSLLPGRLWNDAHFDSETDRAVPGFPFVLALRRALNRQRDVTLSDTFKSTPCLVHPDMYRHPAGPRPQLLGVADRNVQQLAVLVAVRVPGGMFSFPWPCSNMLLSASLSAPSISACFIEAGFKSTPGRSSTPLAISVTAPATIGEATDVPESDLQPPFRLLPFT